MRVNWYPGHMNKAVRELRTSVRKADLILELLDARCPAASSNPLAAELRSDKPSIKLLVKADLADPAVTAAWVAHLQEDSGVLALPHDKTMVAQARSLVERGRALLPADRNPYREVLAVVLGVPNVGKSTLINTLTGRNLAKASNKPAVTRQQQRVRVAKGFALLDTPGFLWPRLGAEAGVRLALSGAVGDHVLDFPELAVEAVRWLARDYPDALRERYDLESVEGEPVQVLEAIAARRGAVRRGGVVDYGKVSELLIRELRKGTLGRLSLERP